MAVGCPKQPATEWAALGTFRPQGVIGYAKEDTPLTWLYKGLYRRLL